MMPKAAMISASGGGSHDHRWLGVQPHLRFGSAAYSARLIAAIERSITGTPQSLRKAVMRADLQGALEDERLGEVFLDRLLPGCRETPLGHVVVGLKVPHAELDRAEAAQTLGHAVVADGRSPSGAPTCGARR